MAPFPDSLPPEGLDPVLKLLIYFGILYILSTAITTWFVTRRRSIPKTKRVDTSEETTTQQVVQTTVGITETMSFDDTKDRLSSIKIEIQGAEAALTRLNELKEEQQLSSNAYKKLKKEYNERVQQLSDKMNEMLQSDIEDSRGQVDEGITDSEMEEIEADLERQLMDLDGDDDFLKPRPKRKMDEIFPEEKSQPSQPSQPSAPAARSTEKAQTPQKPQTPPPPSSTPKTSQQSAPSPTATQPKKVPMPPPPGTSQPSTPSTPSSTKVSSEASQPSATAPPQPKKDKSVPMPPPPKKAAAPPPPKKDSASAASTPQASQPKASQPLSAAQPMKVESEDEEGMFAKSTSIAALRMDMLRELARLKKLIPEDQENDQ